MHRLCSLGRKSVAWLLLVAGFSPAAAPAPVFEKDVLPILQAKCLRCHGTDKRKGDLDARSRPALLKGGESGPSLLPGSPEKSLLWVKVAGDKMPPGKDKLTGAEKMTLRAWIEGGAPGGSASASEDARERPVGEDDGRHWAFRPPTRPPVPAVKQTNRVRNAVDCFVLAALEARGLTLSPEADPATLVRRVCFDLTGLPPTPAQVEAFCADHTPDAYERLVETLLASPHYGERWGRHWLDLAGYADSEGILDADYVRTAAWRYRDYVVRALNADKPYDRFLREQIAGDELTDYWSAYRDRPALPPEVVEGITATGFLRCASDTSRPDFAAIKNAPGYYYQTLDDTLKIVCSSVLGLTLQCARCHGHKYDPIPQREYYQLQAIFMSGYRPSQWVPQAQRRLLDASASQEKEAARVDAVLTALKKKVTDLQAAFATRLFEDRLAGLPEVLRADVRQALTVPPEKRTEVQKYLAGKFEKHLWPDAASLVTTLKQSYPEFARQSAALDESLRIEQARRPALAEIRAFYDLPGEPRTCLLRRGDYLNPGPEVRPGILSALATPRPFAWAPPSRDARTSGRRLAFAEWLTQPDHPLTARVLVNRLWLHHFGEGLVATPDNFGRAGAPPSHTELLDYLATEFVARGWGLKALHRLLLTSATYRQGSAFDPAARANKVDPENRFLWRQRLRRLEAESLRDAILCVAGSLNPEMNGPPVGVLRQPDGDVVTPADAPGRRRSVYLQVRRSQPVTLLQVFDQPVLETNCTRRATSTVSSQALTLLNSDFLVSQADAFAARACREQPADPAGQALFLAFGRRPTSSERATLEAFLARQTTLHAPTTPDPARAARNALADLCHMLLSANEFVYVD